MFANPYVRLIGRAIVAGILAAAASYQSYGSGTIAWHAIAAAGIMAALEVASLTIGETAIEGWIDLAEVSMAESRVATVLEQLRAVKVDQLAGVPQANGMFPIG